MSLSGLHSGKSEMISVPKDWRPYDDRIKKFTNTLYAVCVC